MTPLLIKAIPVLLLFAGLAFVKWRLTPPDKVLGTCLEDTPERTKGLLRAVQEQHYRESWHRADPN